MKYVSYLFGGLSTIAAAVYLVIYLYRWEWQRAVICGVLLLAVEGFLVCVILLGRMGRLERRLIEADTRVEAIRRPPPRSAGSARTRGATAPTAPPGRSSSYRS